MWFFRRKSREDFVKRIYSGEFRQLERELNLLKDELEEGETEMALEHMIFNEINLIYTLLTKRKKWNHDELKELRRRLNNVKMDVKKLEQIQKSTLKKSGIFKKHMKKLENVFKTAREYFDNLIL